MEVCIDTPLRHYFTIFARYPGKVSTFLVQDNNLLFSSNTYTNRIKFPPNNLTTSDLPFCQSEPCFHGKLSSFTIFAHSLFSFKGIVINSTPRSW